MNLSKLQLSIINELLKHEPNPILKKDLPKYLGATIGKIKSEGLDPLIQGNIIKLELVKAKEYDNDSQGNALGIYNIKLDQGISFSNFKFLSEILLESKESKYLYLDSSFLEKLCIKFKKDISHSRKKITKLGTDPRFLSLARNERKPFLALLVICPEKFDKDGVEFRHLLFDMFEIHGDEWGEESEFGTELLNQTIGNLHIGIEEMEKFEEMVDKEGIAKFVQRQRKE